MSKLNFLVAAALMQEPDAPFERMPKRRKRPQQSPEEAQQRLDAAERKRERRQAKHNKRAQTKDLEE